MIKEGKSTWKICLYCGIFIWFVINLLQGIFTEITEDEAYYALFGEHLDWGYFDHPPMVGLMTFLGGLLFSGNLGVRFLGIVATTITLLVIWKIIGETNPNRRKVLLFFTLAFSVVMLNVYGFVTTPDVGLLLFSALFLLVYQKYIESNSWPHALLLGVLMSAMIYSKYHAFLLLGLVVLSNLKLLKDGKFWTACLLAVVLLVPHLLWQYNNGFPSFKYHLVQRGESFRWSYFFEYLPNQLLIFNPLTFGAAAYVLIKHKPIDRFERALHFICIGFFAFFFLMTFRGHVEPHWTIVCSIPIIVLIYRKCLIDDKLKKYVRRFVLPSLVLIFVVRIVLLTPLASRWGFYGKEKYYKAIETVAGDNPVIFRGSFQKPSLYHYFTGKESSTTRDYYDRMTQFDLWQFDKDWMGKPVFICSPVYKRSTQYLVDDVCFEGYQSQHYQSSNRLVSSIFVNDSVTTFHRGERITMDFSIYNPLDYPIDFHHDELSMTLKIHFLSTDDFAYCRYDSHFVIEPHSTYQGSLSVAIPDDIELGSNRMVLGIGDRIGSSITDENQVTIEVVD